MIAPPIVAVFMLGMFWKRGTSKAANVTFIVGITSGVIVFLLDFPYENLLPGFKSLAEAIANAKGVELLPQSKAVTGLLGVGFMMQAWWKFVLCAIIMVAVSLKTTAPSAEQTSTCINMREYWPKKWNGISDYRVVGGLIMFVLITMWIVLELVA